MSDVNVNATIRDTVGLIESHSLEVIEKKCQNSYANLYNFNIKLHIKFVSCLMAKQNGMSDVGMPVTFQHTFHIVGSRDSGAIERHCQNLYGNF